MKTFVLVCVGLFLAICIDKAYRFIFYMIATRPPKRLT